MDVDHFSTDVIVRRTKLFSVTLIYVIVCVIRNGSLIQTIEANVEALLHIIAIHTHAVRRATVSEQLTHMQSKPMVNKRDYCSGFVCEIYVKKLFSL